MQRTQAEARPGARPRRSAAIAAALIFFVNGVGFGNWVPRIPDVQEALGLNEAVLGAALLGIALGSIFSMPAVGWLVARHGSVPLTRLTLGAFVVTLGLLPLAGSFPALFALLFLYGAATGGLDVAMNAAAASIEKARGSTILGACHGLFSLGGMAGALLGGVIADRGVAPLPHLAGIAVLLGLASLAILWFLPRDVDTEPAEGPVFRMPSGVLVGLGVITFCALMSEGAVADWSALYLREQLAGPGVAALGYAGFSLAMAVGRLTGDRLVDRFGAAAMLRGGGLLATCGLAAGLLGRDPVLGILGFVLVGFGIAGVVPIVFRAAASAPGMAPGASLAAVSTTGYLGFLAGPPLIGFVADAVGLPAALGLVVVLTAVVALLAGPVLGVRPRALRPAG